MKEGRARRKKRQPIPKAVQRGRLRAAALSIWFFVLFLLSFSWRVLGCGARQRAALVYAKHTSRCQMVLFSIKCRMSYLSKIMECIYQPHVL